MDALDPLGPVDVLCVCVLIKLAWWKDLDNKQQDMVGKHKSGRDDDDDN